MSNIAISGYTKPQSRLFQVRENLANSTTDLRHACVVAPRYRVSRYGVETAPLSAFASQAAPQVLSFRYTDANGAVQTKPAAEVVDQSFSKLYGVNLEATLATLANGDPDHFTVKSATETNVLVLAGGDYVGSDTPDSDLADNLMTRDVTPGDIAYVTTGGKTFRRRVLGLRGEDVAATWGANDDGDDSLVANSPYNPATAASSTFTCTLAPTGIDTAVLTCTNADDFQGTVKGAVYNNTMGDLFTLTVTTGGAPGVAVVSVTSASGLYSGIITTANADGNFSIVGTADTLGGLRLVIDADAGNLVAGQVFKASISSKYTRLADSGGVSKITASGTYVGASDTVFVIEVTTGTYSAGTAQVETATAAGTVSGSGDAEVVVTGAGIAGSPLALSVAVLNSDTPSVWAAKVRAELAATAAITDLYVVGGTGTSITLTELSPNGNDGTLNISLDNDTCTGITTAATSTNTTSGVAGAPTATGAVVRVSDTLGLFESDSHTVTNNVAFVLGDSGLSATINLALATCPQGGLRKGDRYYINAMAATESTTKFDKVVLDGPAVDPTVFINYATAVDVEFRRLFTGEIAADASAGGEAWTQSGTAVTTNTAMSLFVADRSEDNEWCQFVDGVGSLALSWRALQPLAAGQNLLSCSNDDDVTALWGPIDPANDGAYATHLALQGSAGKVVYGRPLGGTAVADYNAAFAALSRTNFIRYIHVTADDADVRAALKTHVVAASAPDKKFFREGFCGTDSRGEYAVLTTVSSNPLTCTVGAYQGSGNLLVTATNVGTDFTALSLSAGDLVKFPLLDFEFEIASVLSETEIVLEAGPNAPISPAAACEIWKADTAANQASWVKAQADALSKFRVRLHWVEGALDEDDVAIPARFVAAWAAGRRSALPAQQSMTRQTADFMASANPMFLRYEDAVLNDIASHGVTIIAQDAEGAVPYIRHELTTETDKGPLYYEGMCVSNGDEISAKLAVIDEGYVGVTNLTNQTLVDLRNDWIAELHGMTQAPVGDRVGPALTRFDTPQVVVDRNLKDRAKISAKTYMPLPFNHVDGEVEMAQDSSLLTIVDLVTA